MGTFQQFEDTEHAGNHFLAGILCGVALGAVAGLLLAPRRGAELREQVADSMNRASRRAVDTYTKASETMNDIAERAADLAGNLTDRAAALTARLNRTMSSRTMPPVS
jgi:gas vesicle protein